MELHELTRLIETIPVEARDNVTLSIVTDNGKQILEVNDYWLYSDPNGGYSIRLTAEDNDEL